MSEATNNGAGSAAKDSGKTPEVPKSDNDLINDMLKQGDVADADLEAQKKKIIDDINKYLEKKKQAEQPKDAKPLPVEQPKAPEKTPEPEKPAEPAAPKTEEVKAKEIEPAVKEPAPAKDTKVDEPKAPENTNKPTEAPKEPSAPPAKPAEEAKKDEKPAEPAKDVPKGVDTSEEVKESDKKPAAAEPLVNDDALKPKPHVDVLGALAHTNTLLPPSMIDAAVNDALAHEAQTGGHHGTQQLHGLGAGPTHPIKNVSDYEIPSAFIFLMVFLFLAGSFRAVRQAYYEKNEEREKGSVADTLLGGAPPKRNMQNATNQPPKDIIDTAKEVSDFTHKTIMEFGEKLGSKVKKLVKGKKSDKGDENADGSQWEPIMRSGSQDLEGIANSESENVDDSLIKDAAERLRRGESDDEDVELAATGRKKRIGEISKDIIGSITNKQPSEKQKAKAGHQAMLSGETGASAANTLGLAGFTNSSTSLLGNEPQSDEFAKY